MIRVIKCDLNFAGMVSVRQVNIGIANLHSLGKCYRKRPFNLLFAKVFYFS